LGVREAEPPQRLRSNEFGTAAATSSNRQGRGKSMLPQGSGLSSGKRQSSVSRLPLPGANKVRTGGRSSSTGGPVPMGERGRNTTTPLNKGVSRASSGNRSSERIRGNPKTDYMTPQRVASTRKSMTSEKRLTSNVMGSHQRLSGRGSQIGAKGGKDTRPLGDKTFQQSQVRRILDFLRMNGYQNDSLTSKHFPLSSKEFVCIFNFMYFFIDPRTDTVLPLTRFDEEVLKLLKSIHYPGNLSRSNFVTMGSLHSWPTVLGSLAFLSDLASLYTQKLYPNIIPLGFPSKDEMGFATDRESDDKLHFEHNLNCWSEFNSGADDFPEQVQAFHENLMENNGVDVQHLEYLDQQRVGMEQELDRLEGRDNRRVGLLENKQVLQSDIAKMTEYLHKVETHNHDKQEEVRVMQSEQEELAGRIETIDVNVLELKSNCEQGKVSQFEVERNSVLIGERQRLVLTARCEVEEMEKEVWTKEIDVSRGREVLDTLAKQVNSLALQEGLRTKAGELVSIVVDSFQGGRGEESTAGNTMRSELGEMARASRTLTRNTEREHQGVVATFDQGKEEVVVRKKEVASKEGELARLTDEAAKYKDQTDKEGKCYDAQLTDIKTQLHHLKSQDKVNTEMLERELTIAKENLENIQVKRTKEKEAGLEFLRKVADKTVTYMEECTGYRDKAARAVLEAARDRVEMVRRAGTEMQEKVDRAVKETERN